MKTKRTAFTLIELLVVIAIIALLLSVLLPGLRRAKEYAKRVICASRLGQIGVAMKLYADAYKDFLPSDMDNNGKREMHGFVVYREDWKFNGKLIPLRFARLYEAGYMDVPEVFYCPANRLAKYKYESYTNPAPWGTLPQAYNTQAGDPDSWVRIGYTYYPVELRAKIDPATNAPVELATKYTSLNLNIPYAADVLVDKSDLGHQFNKIYAVNALFGDGHVSCCNDQSVFNNPIWERFKTEKGTLAFYNLYYYTIFKLITP